MATGEWIHDYLNRSGGGGGNAIKRNKSVNNGQRLYVAAQGLQPPSASVVVAPDNKKNIKRSWTISSKIQWFFGVARFFLKKILNIDHIIIEQ